MRSFIVGTAGHIDHGKSALVRALTGIDPDRLKEEKERGITIDLGFAHLPARDGVALSFVDVPGHERFVRNMLAGAHGIDAVLLVVAADESVMPQTREHFEICRLLGISAGLTALTKCDLADEETRSLAELEVRELVAGSFLEGSPIVRTSVRTGQGLERLRVALQELAAIPTPRPDDGLLRLPVDRSFTLRGFGTVVTGTLVSGSIRVGDDLALLPAGRSVRVRGLQVHGIAVEEVGAGNRTAVNLAGLEVSEVRRGDVLVRPGTLQGTSMVDVVLGLLPGERPLRDGSRVRVHAASAEVLARVRLLDAGTLTGGTEALAQLRLESPVVVGRGDRLILRSYSPATTIGGARVVDPLPPKRQRRDRELVARAAALVDAEPAAAAIEMLRSSGIEGRSASDLAARVGIPVAELTAALRDREPVMAFGQESVSYLAREALAALADRARAALAGFHEAQPLRAAMSREELRRRVFGRAPAGAFEQVLAELAERGEIRTTADGVSLAAHAVRLTPEEARARMALVEAARGAGLSGLDREQVIARSGAPRRTAERVVAVLLESGELTRVGEALLVDSAALVALKEEVRRRWPPGTRLDVAEVKQLTQLSRKYVIPLLEYLDREKVTRRAGADRVVLG